MNIERLLEMIGATESSGRWDAWNPSDGKHKGKPTIAFGKFQFNQAGGLCGLLNRMYAAEPNQFLSIFGESTPRLLDYKSLAEMDLTAAGWRFRFTQASKVPAFQKAQVDEIVHSYIRPAAKLCVELGFTSWMALTVISDVSVQYGTGGCKKLMREAVGSHGANELLKTFAGLADGKLYERRKKLLNMEELRDAGEWEWDSEKWGYLPVVAL